MALAAVVLAASVMVLIHSSAFRVHTINVSGTSSLSRAEVVRLSGITASSNVLLLNLESVERRLRSDPWIARAVVSRRLPWTIDIKVIERTAVASVRVGQGYAILAGDGVTLGTVARDPGLPAIELPAGTGAVEPVGASAAPAQAIGGLDRGGRIAARAVVNADGTFSVGLSDGTRIDFGEPVQVEAKTRAARRILQWARATGATLIHISVAAADAPAATPA